MSEDQPKITTLGRFVDRVSQIRKEWGIDEQKELWFRGEGEKHERSILRPALYRPPKGGRAMREIAQLLNIECELYEEFQRCGAQLLGEKMQVEDQDWDWYFLMRHHDAPTRLLDWSDGAMIALHFALNSKTKDALRDPKAKEHCKPRVYLLGPDRLKDCLNRCSEENRLAKERWGKYVEKHPSFKYGEDREDEWEFAYLPADKEEREELPIPPLPLLLDFPHITRRVAAQRSRFVVFGERGASEKPFGLPWHCCSDLQWFRDSGLPGSRSQDPQYFCDRLGVLMRAMARRDDVFALRAVQV